MKVEDVFKNNHTRMLDELLSYACVADEVSGINVYHVSLCCIAFDVYAMPLYPVLDADGNHTYTHFMVYDMRVAKEYRDE